MVVKSREKLDLSMEESYFRSDISSMPCMQKINLKRIRIDPKIVKRFNLKLGKKEWESYGSARHEYVWTSSRGRKSGWVNVEELAQSIQRDGIINTPLVCSFKRFGYGEDIVAVQGWRRIRAAVLNKFEQIEVSYTEDLSPEEAEVLSFKENYNREQLSDLEIAEFLYKVKKRYPDWSYEKIGEVYGLGGKSSENRRKVVGTYLSHYDFLECHRENVKRFDIRLKRLTRGVTMQIRATAREIADGRKKEEVEMEILRAFSKDRVPVGLLCKILRIEHKRGNPITPLEAVDLIRQNAALIKNEKEGLSYYLVIPTEITEALKRYVSERIPETKKGASAVLLLEIAKKFLKQEGYL
ncbi:MAG: ParB/RepB/Spo0J family partition protein [Candidatus Jordarchaeum sp.]|uniref:ParB/RepB/Spo0J family partition protein n=1 Tax=Candidatus Jordarchaeum sp. TaxID=2823881 RepID=UPI0040491112